MVLFPQHDMIAKQTILLENILAITCKFQRILYGISLILQKTTKKNIKETQRPYDFN